MMTFNPIREDGFNTDEFKGWASNKQGRLG